MSQGGHRSFIKCLRLRFVGEAVAGIGTTGIAGAEEPGKPASPARGPGGYTFRLRSSCLNVPLVPTMTVVPFVVVTFISTNVIVESSTMA